MGAGCSKKGAAVDSTVVTTVVDVETTPSSPQELHDRYVQEPPGDQIPEYTGFTTIPDTSTKTLIEVLKLDKTISTDYSIECFCVLADASRIFTVGKKTDEAKNTIYVWDVATGDCVSTMDREGHADCVHAICVSADGSRCFSGSSDTTIKVWDVATGDCLQTLEGHAKSVYSVCVSADGCRCFSGDSNGVIKVWDVATGTCVQTLKHEEEVVMSLCMSAGGRLFSGGGDHTIKEWNPDTGTCVQTMEACEYPCEPHPTSGHTNDVTSMCVSAEIVATLVSGSSDNTIKVWDVASGACVQTLEGCARPVFSVYVSADGATCFSGSGDNTIKVWNVDTGACVQTLEGNGNSACCGMCVSADRSKLFSQTDEKTITVWSITETSSTSTSN